MDQLNAEFEAELSCQAPALWDAVRFLSEVRSYQKSETTSGGTGPQSSARGTLITQLTRLAHDDSHAGN
jgi:hypothetical protein